MKIDIIFWSKAYLKPAASGFKGLKVLCIDAIPRIPVWYGTEYSGRALFASKVND